MSRCDLDGLVRIVKKIQYRPHLIDGCLAGTGLRVEPGKPMHYEFNLVSALRRPYANDSRKHLVQVPGASNTRNRMPYYDAAVQILGAAKRPLTIQEITDRAIEEGLVVPRGKTPYATMSAALYKHLGVDTKLVKVDVPGPSRAIRGSVRWQVQGQ